MRQEQHWFLHEGIKKKNNSTMVICVYRIVEGHSHKNKTTTSGHFQTHY